MGLLGLLLVLRLSERGRGALGLVLLAVVRRRGDGLLSEEGSLRGESGGGVRVRLGVSLGGGGGLLLVLVVLLGLLVQRLGRDGGGGRGGGLVLVLLVVVHRVELRGRLSLGLDGRLDVLGLLLLVLDGLRSRDRLGRRGRLGSVLLLGVTVGEAGGRN